MIVSQAAVVLLIVFVTGCGVVTLTAMWVVNRTLGLRSDDLARNVKLNEEVEVAEERIESLVEDVERMRRDYERASKQRDEARKSAAHHLKRYEAEETARHEAREECGKARKEAAANRITELRLSDNSQMIEDRDLARAETEQVKRQLEDETAISERAVVRMVDTREEKIEPERQRAQAVADTKRATEELAGVRGSLMSARDLLQAALKENDKTTEKWVSASIGLAAEIKAEITRFIEGPANDVDTDAHGLMTAHLLGASKQTETGSS